MISLILFLLVCLGVGFVGASVTSQAIPDWYVFLNKPPGMPPNWVFGPVWTMLYILMAVSAWFIWRKRKELSAMPALRLFGAQLTLNALWTPVFFGMRNPALAMAVILTMWGLIFMTIRAFMKIEKRSAFLLFPYMIWSTYATYLNAGIWKLNS